MDKIRTVSIIGLGAIGSFLAVQLQPVLGENLRIIAGGARKERIERDGVVANGEQFNFKVTSPEEKTGFADLAIIIPKFSGLKSAIEDIKNQIGPDTLIMAPLNGVESEEIVSETYGSTNVIYSLMMVSVVMQGNACRFDPKTAQIQFGEKLNKEISPRIQLIKDLFESAGLRTHIPEDMIKAIWFKYMINVSENQSSAVLGLCYNAWQGACPSADFIRRKLEDEVVKVAAAQGITITNEERKKHEDRLKILIPTNIPSTRQDIIAGRKTEVDIFAGTMIRLGEKLGVPVPYNEMFYHAIKVFEAKNDGII